MPETAVQLTVLLNGHRLPAAETWLHDAMEAIEMPPRHNYEVTEPGPRMWHVLWKSPDDGRFRCRTGQRIHVARDVPGGPMVFLYTDDYTGPLPDA